MNKSYSLFTVVLVVIMGTALFGTYEYASKKPVSVFEASPVMAPAATQAAPATPPYCSKDGLLTQAPKNPEAPYHACPVDLQEEQNAILILNNLTLQDQQIQQQIKVAQSTLNEVFKAKRQKYGVDSPDWDTLNDLSYVKHAK